MVVPFRDRRDAGRQLATRLAAYADRSDVLVLALPRGGVPVAAEVAAALAAPLDLFLVRKLGVPGHEELAMGAIASGGLRVLNDDVVRELAVPAEVIEAVAAGELHELARRERLYRGLRPTPDVRGQTLILVDDGLATGSTMRAAAEALRLLAPARIVAAVPVAARAVCDTLTAVVDELVCVVTPHPFYAVGLWYEDFTPTTDAEVQHLLRRSRPDPEPPAAPPPPDAPEPAPPPAGELPPGNGRATRRPPTSRLGATGLPGRAGPRRRGPRPARSGRAAGRARWSGRPRRR